nr:hypothetical protein HmN_000540000 [Hymenolepis microstoma]
MDKNEDCLGKIPFRAVVAFILVFTGASVAAGTLYKAFVETEDIFATNFIAIPCELEREDMPRRWLWQGIASLANFLTYRLAVVVDD